MTNLQEASNLDFKESMPWNAFTKGSLARDFLGMSNHRDGGYIVIGVREDKSANLMQVQGVAAVHRETFNLDNVCDYSSSCSGRGLRIEMSDMTWDELPLLVFEIQQFEDTPTICSRAASRPKLEDSEPAPESDKLVLRPGAIYSRPTKGKPQTREATADDLAHILDIAFESRMQRQVIPVLRALQAILLPPEPSLRDKYRQERGEF